MDETTARKLIEQAMESLVHRCATPDDVAAYLDRQGIRGVPECSSACPLRVYLKSQVPDEVFVDVTQNAVVVWVAGRPPAVAVPMDEILQRFVGLVDDGRYPGLVEEASGWRLRGGVLEVCHG